MKILFISGSIIPSQSANSLQVMKMSEALAHLGHEVTLIGRAPSERVGDAFNFYGIENCFQIIHCEWPNHRFGGFKYAFHIRQVTNTKEYDFVLSRSPYPLLSLGREEPPLVIYETHCPPRTRFHQLVERTISRRRSLCCFAVISHALSGWYAYLFPWLYPSKLLHLPSGSDGRLTNRVSNPAQRVASGRLQIGYIGHLYPGKGMELIIKLAKVMPDADFHVVGGTDEDCNRWRTRVDERNVVFHGFKRREELEHYYGMFDILIAPYQGRVATFGGRGDIGPWMSPLKVFEYMSFGLPIVASDLPVLREVLEHGVSGLLCRPDDVDEWVRAIRRLQNNSDERAELGKRAREVFLTKFTWQRRADRLLEFVERSIGKYRTREKKKTADSGLGSD